MATEKNLELDVEALQEQSVHIPTSLPPQTGQPPVSPQSSNTSSHEEITRKSRKDAGYKNYCDFISHVNDFLIIRRFGSLTVRVLLALQDKVVCLEEKLKELDEIHSRPDAGDVHNGSFRQDAEDRKALICEIHSSLKEYFSFAKQFSAFAPIREPWATDVTSLNNWFRDHPDSIHPLEQAYLSPPQHCDLFPLVPKSKPPLRKLLEKWSFFKSHSYFRRTAPSTLPRYEQEKLVCFSTVAMNRIISIIIVSTGMAMLIAPAWILEFLDSSIAKLAVISAFVVAFTGMVQYAIIVRHGEVLAAAAAYAAVLMVFLQLGHS